MEFVTRISNEHGLFFMIPGLTPARRDVSSSHSLGRSLDPQCEDMRREGSRERERAYDENGLLQASDFMYFLDCL